jgi:hippurate hydrolase
LFDGRFGQIERVFGMHNIPGMEVGQFATRCGPITSSESLFEITIRAQGGHAAMPHMGVDAILVGSEMVGSLQTVVSRKLDPSLNGVVSVTGFEADGQRNVLAGNATLSGDCRALTPGITADIERNMRLIVEGVALAHGVQAELKFDTIFPATINDRGAVDDVISAAAAVVGSEHLDSACPPKLFSEDFAHMTNAVPGCFVLMGNGTTGRNARPLHAADYDFNDEGLEYGSSLWTQIVLDACGKN